MPLPSGTKLGPYEILTPIGKGGMDSHSWSREILLSDVLAGHSSGGVIEGPVAQHGDGDSENAIHNASESSSIALAAGTKTVVVLFSMGVAEDGNACPVMQSVVEGQRASSSHEDLRVLLAAFYRFSW